MSERNMTVIRLHKKGSQIFLSLCSHSDPLETLQSFLKLHGCEGDNLMIPLHEVQCLCVCKRE